MKTELEAAIADSIEREQWTENSKGVFKELPTETMVVEMG